jgi:hypothetical protein
LPGFALKTIHAETETAANGRFEIRDLSGHSLTILDLKKNGYEPEFLRSDYGEYGPQSGSVNDPIVFRMWSTNLHQPLITGEKSFSIIPDGRSYGIDLLKGTIAEGQQGDLVVKVKRPESVKHGQRYDWSCELAVPAGGLCEHSHYAMFTAPETGYTNLFGFQQEASANGWGDETGDKRFYLKLRNGQIYGRVTIGLFAYYNAQTPGLVRCSYAINPSGSRLLR